jgi:hypothetical protein
MRNVGLLITVLLISFCCGAQEIKKDSLSESPKDTTGLANDSIRMRKGNKIVSIESYAKRFDPRKALFYAAILPGAGQAYNKKYWKIPLVYGGLLGLLAVVKFYDDAEVKYKSQLFYNINNPNITYNPVSGGTTAQLRTIVDQARRQRDYFSIFTGLFYILQMVDAHVDAHLKEFDLNPKLHVRIEPTMSPSQGVGMGLTLKF